MRLPRVRLRTLMIAVAVVAVACAWPRLFIFAGSLAAGAFTSFGLCLIWTTRVRRLFE